MAIHFQSSSFRGHLELFAAEVDSSMLLQRGDEGRTMKQKVVVRRDNKTRSTLEGASVVEEDASQVFLRNSASGNRVFGVNEGSSTLRIRKANGDLRTIELFPGQEVVEVK